jgi:hypothetical protein
MAQNNLTIALQALRNRESAKTAPEASAEQKAPSARKTPRP